MTSLIARSDPESRIAAYQRQKRLRKWLPVVLFLLAVALAFYATQGMTLEEALAVGDYRP